MASESVRKSQTFGNIPGIRVGKTFPDREACHAAGVHGVSRGGIHGSSTEGAYSVVLSGGYDEDEDRGDTFTYTGSGGVGTQAGSSFNPAQTEDQSFDNRNNRSLQVSAENKRPVRVVRGYCKDLDNDSAYAPAEGYRYDGLYIVDRACIKKGKHGFNVCSFDFRRVQGQRPIPVRAAEME